MFNGHTSNVLLLSACWTYFNIIKPSCQTVYVILTYEPSRGKTNNVVSEQVRHKPACTATEAG